MPEVAIPFEIHLTTDAMWLGRQDDFLTFCTVNEAKPLIIELSKGDFIHQPMLSKIIYADAVVDVLVFTNKLSNALNTDSFFVKRLKIEVPSQYSGRFDDFNTGFKKYFEWHCKISYTNTSALQLVCDKHNAHLSVNSLKTGDNTRFITLREFGSKAGFKNRIAALLQALELGDWTIIKQESEYCIYDNNIFLDNGWLL
jgi:hypothetical protein